MRRFMLMLLAGMLFVSIHLPIAKLFAQPGGPGDMQIQLSENNRHCTPSLPCAIVANEGQWKPSILYADMLGRFAFTREGILMEPPEIRQHLTALEQREIPLHTNKLPDRLRFIHPSPKLQIVSDVGTAGVGNFYSGRDSMKWRSGMPIRTGVRYRNVWDSVDAEFREETGRLALKLRLRPGARPRSVVLESSADDAMQFTSNTTDFRPLFPCVKTTQNGTYIYTLSGYADTIASTTEFSTYIGGNDLDKLSKICIDTDGSMYLNGYTNSNDWLAAGVLKGVYVLHLACDGRTVLYNSIYSPDPGYHLSDDAADQTQMCLRQNDHVIVSGFADDAVMHIPLTSDALEPDPSDYEFTAFIFELNETGRLYYATLFGGNPKGKDHSSTIISSITLDSRDNLCIAGTWSGKFKYITPGTIDIPHQTDDAGEFLVKLRPTLDSVLWGSRIGVNTIYGKYGLSIALDSLDCPIINGFINGPDVTIPLVNAAYPEHRDHGMYLQKLTPNADAFVFSTYLGGFTYEVSQQANPVIGPGNTIHLVGMTHSPDFPIIGSSLGYVGNWDGFYMNVSPEGRILRSFCLGGTREDDVFNVHFDGKGNVYLLGATRSGDFPVRGSFVPYNPRENFQTTLTVLQAESDSILLSTRWNVDVSNLINGEANVDVLHVRSNGYVYLAGVVKNGLPVFNALRSDPSCTDSIKAMPYYPCNEGFLTRLYLPFAGQDFLRCTVTGTDTLQLETSHHILSGSRFTLTVRVTNPSLRDTAWNPLVMIRMPAGATLDPPDQGFSRNVRSPFLPGDTASFTWTVRVDSVRDVDSMFAFRAVTEFDREPAPLSCERPFVRGAHYVPVRRFIYQRPIFSCALEGQDSLAISFEQDSLVGNPFTVRGRIRNIGSVPFTLAKLVLQLPTAGIRPWLQFAPAGDSLRPGGTIAPGGELVRDWLVRASNMPQARECLLRMTVSDSFEVRVPGCETVVTLPAAQGITCDLTGPDSMRFDSVLGGYAPSPFELTLLLTSLLDTAQGGIITRLDISRATHLRPALGETLQKILPPVLARDVMGSRWLLEVIPHPATLVDDTLVVWYSAPGWPAERSCAHIVRIVPPLQAVSCALAAPNVTVTPEGRYAPDTMTVTWTLTNGGETTVLATRSRLAITGDTTWCLDPLEQSVPALAAKQSAVRTWRLAPPTSPFGRGVALVVTARDSVQNEIARCRTTLELPRVWPVVECTLTGPDTVHYLSATDSYQPDPSDLSYNVTNRVDTTITLTAVLDLASAPHLALAPGETGARALGQLAPRATANAVFRVTVDPKPETNVTDMPNAITTAHYGETADDVGCSTLITIEGREKVYAATCFTAGHDTSWADVGNEDIIPHPLQMRLGIVNTGNEPLAGVMATIILPAGYILTTPPDSIQSYPAIAPGDTGRREWLMEVNREHPVEGAGTVRWTWSNARTSGECTREAVLLQGSPQGIALSRWRLDFRAERGKALPPAESVNIWTGNNNPYQWASASADGWLSVSSGVLTGRGTVTIQPNTTALPEGFYEGTVAIVTSEFARPTPIEVGYEVYTLASAPAPPAPAIPLLTCSPNPVRPGGVLEVRYTSAAAGAGPVRLRLIDALGREAIAAATAPQTARMSLALPASLASGLYFVEVTSREGRMVRGVAVMP